MNNDLLYWKGKRPCDMSKEELIEALNQACMGWKESSEEHYLDQRKLVEWMKGRASVCL